MAYITYTKGEERMTFEVKLNPKMRAKMYGMLKIQTAKKRRIDFIGRMAENENLK